jgi:CelD/BcsL family acetyltransferase involved in cellulose biosynthesis
MTYALELLDAREPRVEATWRLLEARAQPPFFLSWGWVENWRAALPADETPQLAVISNEGVPLAAFFLGRRRTRRHVVLPTTSLYLNATGLPRRDDVCIEHNGLLAAPGAARSLGDVVELLPPDWDELNLPAIDRYAFDDLGAPSSRFNVQIVREALAPFVDLDAVRGVEGGYAALLDSSTRTQLQRALRQVGELSVEVAEEERHALDIFDELVERHPRRVFADPWLERFHRRLILRRLRHGEIQLLRVRAERRTLGCMYNFVFRGRVTFYQAALATDDDPQVLPGYVCHAAAIGHNALAGHAVYDFLGDRHDTAKRHLATGTSRLVWLRVQRPLTRFTIENQVRKWIGWGRSQLALKPAT